jgi:hypothetical protein
MAKEHLSAELERHARSFIDKERGEVILYAAQPKPDKRPAFPAPTPVSASRRPVLASKPMRLSHVFLLLCLLVSLPVNSVMAAMMPLCLSAPQQTGGTPVAHAHATGVQHGKHAHNGVMDICKLACEQCSVCAQAALPPSLIPVPQLPISTVRSPLPDTLVPPPAPTPPFRPPLHLL